MSEKAAKEIKQALRKVTKQEIKEIFTEELSQHIYKQLLERMKETLNNVQKQTNDTLIAIDARHQDYISMLIRQNNAGSRNDQT